MRYFSSTIITLSVLVSTFALALPVLASAQSLPSGVTLQQIDGGPNYYCNNGFTYACNAGWDNPSFFPIGPWLAPMLSQTDANRWQDLGFNTGFLVTGNSNVSLLRSNGMWLITGDDPNILSQIGSETVELLSADENWDDSVATIGSMPNSIQDHRPWWLQNTWTVIGYGDIGGVPMATRMSEPHPTPNGTTRHFDILSADTYWFTGSKDGGMLGPWGQIYDLGRNMTEDEGARAMHYGDMVDRLRAYVTTYPAPLAQFIENGSPGNVCNDSDYITPPEMNAAAWSSIIHGARQLIYFNHSFCGSHQSQDNFNGSYYQTIQPGQTISIYNQAKATHALIKQLAPVINSPFAIGYASVNPGGWTFGQISNSLSGFDVMAKYYNGTFYVFAQPRYSETLTNQTATFTIKNTGATSVTVVNEGRTIPVTNGGTTFTDTFANGNTVHIYQVGTGTPPPTDTTPPSTPTGLTASAVSSSQINLSWTASTDNVGVTGYQIYRGGTLLTTVTGTSYSNTGLSPSTSYSYYVRATDAAGNVSGNSNTASATTQAGTPAPTVTISANPTSVSSGGSSTLTWSSANATSCTASGGWSGSKAASGSQTLTNLTSTATYTLTCTGTGGSANNAATITVTPPSGGTITMGETTVFGDTDSGNGNLLLVQDVTLSQTATIQSLSFYVRTASGKLRLGIYDATGPGGGPGALKAQTASFTPVAGWNTRNVATPVSLPPGNYWLAYFPSSSSLSFATNFGIGSYKYANRTYGTMPATFPTVNGSGTTHWSLYATLSTAPAGDTTAPSTPTNLTATAISSSQINLSWTASTDNVGVTGYRVFRGGVQVGTPTGTTFSDTGLTASTAYSYTVSAYDAAGNNSAQSSSVSATTLPLPPTVVISAAPQTIGSGDSSTLSWSSTDATSCTGTNFSTGNAISGTVVVSPSATTVYTVSCTGLGGTGTNNVTVTVGALSALPTISFPSGTFTWTTADAVSCTASGGWTGSVGTSGSYSFSAPLSTTYVLTCTGGGTTVQRTITITTSETATVSSKFQIGGSVTTTNALNVRSSPAMSGALLGTQPAGASGNVIGGPVQANGYWWWQVDYASGPDGWSVENWLN